MNTINLDNNNCITFHNTIWNDFVLGFKSNEILNLQFDSIESGIKILDMFESQCIIDNIKYSAIRIHSNSRDSKFLLENSGYSNIETSIKVQTTLTKFNKNPFFEKFNFTLESASDTDIELIKNISTNEFKHGRFFEDAYIDTKISEQRNINWIDDLYKKSNLIVGKKNNKVFAFMAYKITNSDVNFELGGVDSNYSHLAYPFWYRVMMDLKNNGMESINALISANNINVMNLYSHFEFRFSDSFIGYRKFRNK